MADDVWFPVEGVIVGWLRSVDDGDLAAGAEEVFEADVAVVQTDDYVCYVRWLGNDWSQIDPPPEDLGGGHDLQMAAVGTRIYFSTCRREQRDYTRIAHNKDPNGNGES